MSFDLGQMFTPPKSKTPWTAMTTGASSKNTQLERWGPLINSIASMVGNAIFPGAGTIGGAIGGGIGMQGRGTGYQGSDYGWGNVAPTISGAVSGSQAGTPMGIFGNVRSTGGSYINNGKTPIGGYDYNYDRSNDPKGKQFDFSQLLAMLGSMIGNKYGGGMGSKVGSSIGSNVGSNIGQRVYKPKYSSDYAYSPYRQNLIANMATRR